MLEPEVAYAGVFKKEFARNQNDVKPFSEVIKTKTALLTSKCVEQGYPFFLEAQDLIT